MLKMDKNLWTSVKDMILDFYCWNEQLRRLNVYAWSRLLDEQQWSKQLDMMLVYSENQMQFMTMDGCQWNKLLIFLRVYAINQMNDLIMGDHRCNKEHKKSWICNKKIKWAIRSWFIFDEDIHQSHWMYIHKTKRRCWSFMKKRKRTNNWSWWVYSTTTEGTVWI